VPQPGFRIFRRGEPVIFVAGNPGSGEDWRPSVHPGVWRAS
jgi:hypothetical protein